MEYKRRKAGFNQKDHCLLGLALATIDEGARILGGHRNDQAGGIYFLKYCSKT